MADLIIKPVIMEDPILDVQSVKYQETAISGNNITFKTENASSHSNSSSTFSFYTPNMNTMLSRRILLKMQMKVSATGDAGAGNFLFQSNKMGFKQFPICSIINTMQLTLNNSNTTINLADIIHPMALYDSEEKMVRACSQTPAMRDFYSQFEDARNTNKYPYGVFGDNVKYDTRASFAPISITTNTQTAYEAVYEFTVPLMISPLQFDNEESTQGLLYIKSVALNLNYVGNLAARAWGQVNDASFATDGYVAPPVVNIDLPTTPELLLKYVTPHVGQVKYPEKSVYNYANVTRFISNGSSATIAPGATGVITSDNLQLNSIPHSFLIWAKRADNLITVNTPNTYFAIENVSIQFANQSGILSTASQEDLYNMSRNNGLQCSFNEWKGRTHYQGQNPAVGVNDGKGLLGSVMCLKPGPDLPLQDGMVPGMVQTNNFQLTLTVRNVSNVNQIPKLYITTVSQGVIVSGKDGLVAQYTSSITPNVVKNSIKGRQLGLKADKKKLLGGLFVMSPKSLFRLGKHVTRGAAKAISGNVPGALLEIPRAVRDDFRYAVDDAQSLADVASVIGIKQKSTKKKKKKGGSSMLGGKKYDQKDILARLRSA